MNTPKNDPIPATPSTERVVQHVMVVGFHHKRGCLVEFCYPPLQLDDGTDGKNPGKNPEDPAKVHEDPVDLPESWQILASLAIPDGAHNFDSDTVFFHIPDHKDPSRTVFGVSCYRQIATKDLLVKSPDITRSSVQKAVIVLMNYPVFGLIEYKLDIITRVYFGERDFSKTDILVDAYNDLNRHISPAIVQSPDILSGLSIRSLFVRFGSQVITLFKMLLLEKKAIFLHSPIRELTSSILTLCSLMPGLIQEGLNGSAIVYDKRVKVKDKELKMEPEVKVEDKEAVEDERPEEKPEEKPQDKEEVDVKEEPKDRPKDKDKDKDSSSSSSSSSDEEETEAELAARLLDQWNKPASLHGLPLPLFTSNAHLMPYFSISYFDILIADTVRSFIGGSSNQIFRRWQSNIDIFVVGSQIEIDCPNLRRILRPSTEDMHFISYLLKAILNDNEGTDAVDIFDDSQQEFYEGSDEWIRMHFKSYLLHLLRCSLITDKESPEFKAFNPFFMDAFKITFSYKTWAQGPGLANVLKDVEPIHPFSSNRLGYLKLRLQNLLIQRQEQLNQSLNKVANAGGQVLNQARSTVNTWLSSIGTSIHEKARDASLAASTSTWKSYIPTAISTRATQILSPTDSSAPPIPATPSGQQAGNSPAKEQAPGPAPYTPEESETSV